VAVLPADLTLPPGGTGELDPAWFATGTLAVYLPVWIAAGVALVPDGATTEQGDAVVRAYAYWTGYDTKLMQMSAAPNSVSIDKGDISVSYTDGQRKWFAEKAAYWFGQYTTATAAVVPVPVIDNPPRASSSQPFVLSF